MTRTAPPSSAYDEDFFSWTQDQAVALRRARTIGEIDVEHLAEEVEDLGKRDLREVVSFLELLMVHLLKIAGDPASPDVPHWRVEARAFARSAGKAFSPGMRRVIDVAAIWTDATDTLAKDAQDLGQPAPRVRPCPFTLDDLVTEAFDLDRALARLG